MKKVKNILQIGKKGFNLLKKSLGIMQTSKHLINHIIQTVVNSDPSIELSFENWKNRSGNIDLEIWDKSDTTINLSINYRGVGENRFEAEKGDVNILDEDFKFNKTELSNINLSDSIKQKLREFYFEAEERKSKSIIHAQNELQLT